MLNVHVYKVYHPQTGINIKTEFINFNDSSIKSPHPLIHSTHVQWHMPEKFWA